MKKMMFISLFLVSSYLCAQSNFELVFNFTSNTTNDTLLGVDLFDYNIDGNEDLFFSFKNSNLWAVQIYDTVGTKLFEASDSLGLDQNLKFTKPFKMGGTNYLAMLSNLWSNQFKFNLQIIDLTNLQVVDTAEGYTWDYFPFPQYYEEFYLNQLEVFLFDEDSVNISIGYEAVDTWSDIGGAYGIDYSKNSQLFLFNGSFQYSNDPNSRVVQLNSFEVLPKSRIGIGGRKGSSWDIGMGYVDYSKSYLSEINLDGPLPYSYTLSSFEEYNLRLLSSDDSTNYYNGIVCYIANSQTKITLYSISGSTSEILWSNEDDDLTINLITASANLTLPIGNLLCYFSGYTMKIIDRNNGDLLHLELTSIYPSKILSTSNNDQLYFVTKSGTRTINVYKLANINFITTDINIDDDNLIPDEFIVEQNYPNPFNPVTHINYSLPIGKTEYQVTIKVYDMLGRLVAVLFDDLQQPGNYIVEFDGESLSSGIYFYTVTADHFSKTNKMILMK